LVRCAAGVIAIGGGYGTLSEIGFALRLGRPVAALHTWSLHPPSGEDIPGDRLHVGSSAEDAVGWLLGQIAAQR
ncbi:MAG: TIGR00725 family protein, partial [Candidatus Dormibacteraeota bacterium]|nr:TIGR00725 family protein [Candidatus Dormibacteraeota bacterium]